MHLHGHRHSVPFHLGHAQLPPVTMADGADSRRCDSTRPKQPRRNSNPPRCSQDACRATTSWAQRARCDLHHPIPRKEPAAAAMLLRPPPRKSAPHLDIGFLSPRTTLNLASARLLQCQCGASRDPRPHGRPIPDSDAPPDTKDGCASSVPTGHAALWPGLGGESWKLFQYIHHVTARLCHCLPTATGPGVTWLQDTFREPHASCRRWSSNPPGKCSNERPARGTVCGTMRSMCSADAGCSATNYQTLLRGEG